MSEPGFQELGLPVKLAASLAAAGFDAPYAVQREVLPDALAGRDVCARAPTGSGKTLAYGLAVLARVRQARPRHPRALILGPTRELVQQITRHLEPHARALERRLLVVCGGADPGHQQRALRRGVDVLVATPGRLEDLCERGVVGLGAVEIVVLDEADRLADLGFVPGVRRLLARTASPRQTMLFSATLDGDVDALVSEELREAAHHAIDGPAGAGAAPRLSHRFWQVDVEARLPLLVEILARTGKTLVFRRTREGAEQLAVQLEARGLPVSLLHGERRQRERERALEAFTRGEVQALVATDIAARGLDVESVGCVVHFDFPEDSKSFQHRSGRTARAGRRGQVICFVGPDEEARARRLSKQLALDAVLRVPRVEKLGSPRRG